MADGDSPSAVHLPYWRLSAWYFFYFAFIGGFNPYFGLYLKSLGLSAWDIGVLLSLMPLMRLAAPNLWSRFGSTGTARIMVIRLAGALAFAGFVAVSMARGFWTLFAALAVLALFSTAVLPLAESLTLAHLRHRVERYGWIRLWGSIGFIVAVQGTGLLLDAGPMSLLLWVCAGALLASFASALVLPASRETSIGHHGEHGLTLRSPKVLALLGAGFFMSAAHSPLYVFYSIHLVDHGYGKASIGALWSLGVIAEIIVFMSMSRLMAAISLCGILSACFALAVLRFLLIGWTIDWLLVAVVAQAMHGATFGAHHAASVAALNRWFAPGDQTRALAAFGSLSFGAGGMLGNLVSGYTWDAFGAQWTYSLAALFAGIGLVLIRRGMCF